MVSHLVSYEDFSDCFFKKPFLRMDKSLWESSKLLRTLFLEKKKIDVHVHTYTLSGEPVIPWGSSMNPRLRTHNWRVINFQTTVSSSSIDPQKTLHPLTDGHSLISTKSALWTGCVVSVFRRIPIFFTTFALKHGESENVGVDLSLFLLGLP